MRKITTFVALAFISFTSIDVIASWIYSRKEK